MVEENEEEEGMSYDNDSDAGSVVFALRRSWFGRLTWRRTYMLFHDGHIVIDGI